MASRCGRLRPVARQSPFFGFGKDSKMCRRLQPVAQWDDSAMLGPCVSGAPVWFGFPVSVGYLVRFNSLGKIYPVPS